MSEPFTGRFLVAIDTNVLLGVNRKTTFSLYILKLILSSNEDKVWIPGHVWYEYQKNCDSLWKSCKNNLEKQQTQINQSVDKIQLKNASGLVDEKQDEISIIINDLKDKIKKFYSNEKGKYTKSQNQDAINAVEIWLHDKIDRGLTIKETISIFEEGSIRYDNDIPPGFKDKTKSTNRFGDLLIWKELIKKARQDEVDIVYITLDRKDDWNNPESLNILFQEFHEETNKDIQILSLEEYKELYAPNKNSKTIVNSLELIDKQSEHANEIVKNFMIQLKTFELPQNNDFIEKISSINTNTQEMINKLTHPYEKFVDTLHDMYTAPSDIVNETLKKFNADIEQLKQILDKRKIPHI